MGEPIVMVAGFNQEERSGHEEDCESCGRRVLLDEQQADKADMIICPACGQASQKFHQKPLAM